MSFRETLIERPPPALFIERAFRRDKMGEQEGDLRSWGLDRGEHPTTRMKQSSVILLVENDKDYIYLLEQAFRRSDIRNPLRIARYGNEAILYLRGVGIYSDRRNYPLPGLIMIDMTNPDGSSMAVLGWIREQRHFAHVPILVLAGRGQEREVQRAFDRVANACLVKRESLGDLTSVIHSLELLGEQRERRERLAEQSTVEP
jgi:CheY-like chemotaxis protein